jgi:two-component system nitrate/nitrite response regulator NarL
MGPRRRQPPTSGRRSPFVIGIVGRSSFYRQALARSIGQVSAFLPIDLGSGRPNGISRARDHDLDLVLIDLAPEDACRFSEELLRSIPGVRAVAILDDCSEADVERYAKAGFARLVGIEASFEELIRELTGTLRDETDREHRFTRLMQGFRSRPPSQASLSGAIAAALSRRERQVLQLMVRRLSNKEIASELSIEAGTVKNHVHHILRKLQLQSRWDVTNGLG